MFIFLQLTRWYFGVAGISEIELSVRGLALYQLRYLPLILGSIFIFGPVTNAIRYAVVFFPEYKWNTYFPEYFFTARIVRQLSGALPHLWVCHSQRQFFFELQRLAKSTFQTPHRGLQHARPVIFQYIEAKDEQGAALLPVENVWWFEVEGKSYKAFTDGKMHDIILTIIVQLRFVKNYSFWENDKYILRMTDERTEFVMQRTRLKALKERFGAV